jgi:hypothetical protein
MIAMEIIELPASAKSVAFEMVEKINTQYFYKEKNFRRALERSRYKFQFLIEEIVEHEKAHVETARNLGYHAQYCLSDNGFEFQPGAWINDGNIENIPIDDLIAIISAPKKPGYDDELKLRYLKIFKRFY